MKQKSTRLFVHEHCSGTGGCVTSRRQWSTVVGAPRKPPRNPISGGQWSSCRAARNHSNTNQTFGRCRAHLPNPAGPPCGILGTWRENVAPHCGADNIDAGLHVKKWTKNVGKVPQDLKSEGSRFQT